MAEQDAFDIYWKDFIFREPMILLIEVDEL